MTDDDKQKFLEGFPVRVQFVDDLFTKADSAGFDNLKNMIEQLTSERISMKAIGDMLGVSCATINYWQNALSLERLPPGGHGKKKWRSERVKKYYNKGD